MSKVLDFTKAKRRFLTVKLDDDAKTTLTVNTPTKAMYERLFECAEALDKLGKDNNPETVQEAISAMYDASAVALSNNKEKKTYTADDLSELFDVDNLMLFFTTYMDFVAEVAATKN